MNNVSDEIGGVQETQTSGPRFETNDIVIGSAVFIIMVVGFSFLTRTKDGPDFIVGFEIAMILGGFAGIALFVMHMARTFQRHDNQQGKQDYVDNAGPIMQQYMNDMREQQRQDRAMIQALLEDLKEKKEAPRALPAPEPTRELFPPISRPAPKPEPEISANGHMDQPPGMFGVGDVLVTEILGDDYAWFSGTREETRWQGRFSVDLVQHFCESQFPDVGREDSDGNRRWERDDRAYGETARLLVLVGLLVPLGKTWVWTRKVERSAVVQWANSLPRASRQIE